jgi:hypothetical protein
LSELKQQAKQQVKQQLKYQNKTTERSNKQTMAKRKYLYHNKRNGDTKKRREATVESLGFHETIYKNIEQTIIDKRIKAMKNKLYSIAIKNSREQDRNPDEHYIRMMDNECVRGCGALHFSNESTMSKCCVSGHSSSELLEDLPDFLLTYLEDNKFRRDIIDTTILRYKSVQSEVPSVRQHFK